MAERSISGALPLVQERQLPENATYRDDGCDLHPRCLSCPLPRCRYDVPGGKRAVLNIYRDQLIASLRHSGNTVPPKPPDAYVIAEIHVAPEFRGRGFGEAILAYAEEDARQGGFHEMALHTLTTNPAQRLYRRSGFEEAARRIDPEFERITGAEGNVLMIKRLQ